MEASSVSSGAKNSSTASFESSRRPSFVTDTSSDEEGGASRNISSNSPRVGTRLNGTSVTASCYGPKDHDAPKDAAGQRQQSWRSHPGDLSDPPVLALAGVDRDFH